MNRPPALARWLLGRLIVRQDRALLLGDLDEEFSNRARRAGLFAAQAWYWRETVHSLVPLARYRLDARSITVPKPTGDAMWHHIIDDVRYAIRLNGRHRLATTAVIGTMVLGIGVTTAVFSIVNSVLLKPLPFDGSERVVEVGMVGRRGEYQGTMAYPDVQDYRQLAHSFSDFTTTSLNGMTLTQGAAPQFLQMAYVDEAYARVFSIHPILGRFFAADEFEPGASKVVMLSHALWQQQFGGDRRIVGHTVSIDNESRIVVGILPQMPYSFPSSNLDLIAPLVLMPGSSQLNRGSMSLSTAGKMKPGVTIAQARRDAERVASDIAKRFPDANGGLGVRLQSLHDVVVGDVRQLLLLLTGSVAAVLLIACINVANVLLGQSYSRAREFAVRAALGGGSGRIRRQLVTESMLCAGVGGIGGIAITPLLIHALVALYPGELPRGTEVVADARVLGVAVAAAVFAGLLAGLPMARRASMTNLSRDLREGGRSGNTRAQRRFGGFLIGAQVAMSLALVFAAGLLLRTFQTLSHTNLGFTPGNLTLFQDVPSRTSYQTADQVTSFFDNVGRALRAIPGVQEVAMATETPIGGNSFHDVFVVSERGDQGNGNPQVRVGLVDEHFFSVLGAPMLLGRNFSAADGAATPRVVVINDALAKRVYPGESPVGHVIKWNKQAWQIIGVVSSMRMDGPAVAASPELYASLAQVTNRYRYVFVKSAAPPASLVPEMRAALRGVDATVAMIGTTTMDERVANAVASQRFHAALVGGLGVLALFISTMGIYGVVSHAVGQQTREIGIRMALGEREGHVQRRVVSAALSTAVVGALIGIVLSLGASRWLSAFVVGISPRDPVMLASAGMLLLSVAAIAAYIPARRASRVDPLVALRSD